MGYNGQSLFQTETIAANAAALDPRTTALVLVGFQNEYFTPNGIMRRGFTDDAPERVLAATTLLVEQLLSTDVMVVSAPIVFTPTYEELPDPVGVLAEIKRRGAFRAGTDGALVVKELARSGPRIVDVGGRRGLNAFANTRLDDVLVGGGIVDVIVAGALTCLCVDSTARSAYTRGYRVSILSDCTLGRTKSEQDLFCEGIFPLYASVVTSPGVLECLRPHVGADG
ncbi:MAG: hypothetical protein NVS3B12_06960 [Acidimicrobiales bacterium]